MSPVEAVEAYLRRIESDNPRLNAVVALAPDALERAREAESALARGEARGALHGVPLTVKDTIDARGLTAACGSRVRAGFMPEEDAPAVARLRAAGAIILGKTNCPEFALDYTSENPVYGRTNNPHDLARTPGGSSGGCAAAVAACMTAGSLGSDLAGSVRIPAHFCGVLGAEADGGARARRRTVAAFGGTPLARRDARPARAHRRRPAALLPSPDRPDAHGRKRRGGNRWRCLNSRGSIERVAGRLLHGSGRGACPRPRRARPWAARRARWRNAGADVFEATPPGVAGATERWLSLFEYATQRFIRRMYEGREDEAGRAARVILERGARWGAPALEDVLRAWEERDRERAALLGWMEDVPLFVAPVGAVPAFRHEEFGRLEFEGRSVSTFRAFADAHAANVFNLPAVCVPAGATQAGLPIGVQLVGRPHEEALVLDVARVLEESLGGWRPPPAREAESLPHPSGNPL